MMAKGSDRTSTFKFPIFFYNFVYTEKADDRRRIIFFARAGVDGKSSLKLSGFNVIRILCSPADRISSRAGWPATVICCAFPAIVLQ